MWQASNGKASQHASNPIWAQTYRDRAVTPPPKHLDNVPGLDSVPGKVMNNYESISPAT